MSNDAVIEKEVQSRYVQPQTLLYGLQPLGLGTPRVESLTSYIARLADAHCVSVWGLMKYVIVQRWRPALLDGPSHNALQAARSGAINASQVQSRDMVAVLEGLTGRGDLRNLTMLPWANVIGQGSIRQEKRWCPACYEEWRAVEMPIYDPLPWSVSSVFVCPVHSVVLEHVCPKCGKSTYPLTARSRLGFCDGCRTWLGTNTPYEHTALSIRKDATQWREWLWAAQAVGELLEISPSLDADPQIDRVKSAMTLLIDRIADGMVGRFARWIGLTDARFNEYMVGSHLPKLATLLRICHKAGITLVQMLFSNLDDVDLPKAMAGPKQKLPLSGLPAHPKTRQVDRSVIEQRLKNLIEEPPVMPPYIREVAAELGYPGELLTKWFPDYTAVLIARRREYNRAQRDALWQRIINDVQSIARCLYSQGLYPSSSRVGSYLSRPGWMRLPIAKQAWRDVLLELGPQPGTPGAKASESDESR